MKKNSNNFFVFYFDYDVGKCIGCKYRRYGIFGAGFKKCSPSWQR